MGPSQRSEQQHLNLSYVPPLASQQQQAPRSGSSTAATSPIEPPSASRVPPGFSANSVSRLNNSSPSHDYRGFKSFRTRELQAQEGLGFQPWGPPTSGNSTPLRETIPESPNGEAHLPDFLKESSINATTPSTASLPLRSRARAGTLPSRFSPATGLGPLNPPPSNLGSKTSRPTPTGSPFRANISEQPKSSVPSRFRAGSLPPRSQYQAPAPVFGQNYFWTSRDRSSTLASIRSSDGPSSPAQSHFSRDSLADNDVKTLDYLGLAETPKPSNAALAELNLMTGQHVGLQPAAIAELAALSKSNNRFRSYSVNAKEKFADDEDDMRMINAGYSGTMTPSENSMVAAQTLAAIHRHNQEVQAFVNYASASRPRARTAGILDAPIGRGYMSGRRDMKNGLDMPLTEEAEYSGLTEAVESLQLNGHPVETGEEHNVESPTRALWLGNIPVSTTTSSLSHIFAQYGPVESTRVLTHKNCGFVNFENIESAIRARSKLNGMEIFPGAGPVRIGYAKVPSASGTPGNNGIFPSPTPDPQAKQSPRQAPLGPASISTPELSSSQQDIIDIVKELGATAEECNVISQGVNMAIMHDHYEAEIPPIPEPNHNRMHDAPRLREIRKRIDNNAYTPLEIEGVAVDMLPEIAELSSDYLGNTVVQKLFETCSEDLQEAMFERIAPHMAEIGVHKNGTWAAQKIIEVTRSSSLMNKIVDSLRPYAMALFLDQFGNYVIQGCLRYGFPANNFIFEVMLSRLWELAQGRFGARAMRACLESHHATKEQQRMIAAAIALHSVQLATNANGALLLTWFLDTCTFPQRRTVLAPRLVPHLVHLCTHKVAYLTVLKIINQRNEPEARNVIMQALFFSPNDIVLEAILQDHMCGANLIFKVLTTPFLDENIRADVVQNVRNVLVRIKAQPQQGYKRLMDEVGLSNRAGGAPRDAHSEAVRPSSRHAPASAAPQPQIQPALQNPMNQPQVPPQQQMENMRYGYGQGPAGFDGGMQRSDSQHSGVFGGGFAESPAVYGPVQPYMFQQMGFQPQMLRNIQQPYYVPAMGVPGVGVPGMGFQANGEYRVQGSPVVAQGNGFGAQGVNGFGQVYGFPSVQGVYGVGAGMPGGVGMGVNGVQVGQVAGRGRRGYWNA
ncbi:hypothetical protein EJ06DRAFT_556200 [Trichodelitschia bisporula]|uniref:ARM repeat-containing protein n=1 Tax=Trichodelitschia bisporula TaxID=703511 RepID=A0A6G1HXV2_9PEZI|nr:hypothetical protein EJ06DRAFT_556200 [Trichodelitschia bisporula]